jgi:hypothetical protein
MRIAIALPLVALAACISNAVDDRIDPSEYQAWSKKIETYGELPGHGGDSYRIIYANPIAQTFAGGHYPEGSILVKEVHALTTTSGAPAAGALQSVAIMRRLPGTPEGLDDEGGWLFTETSTPGGSETHYAYCWESCHVAGPYQGAWFDYSKPDAK